LRIDRGVGKKGNIGSKMKLSLTAYRLPSVAIGMPKAIADRLAETKILPVGEDVNILSGRMFIPWSF